MRRTLELVAEPRGRTYHDLLYRSFSWCAELLLVVRPLAGGDPLLPSGRAVLRELEPYLRSESAEREWPGTELEDGTATVYRYGLVPPAIDVIAEATDHLYGWRLPALPEDLALVRGDGSPWLMTVSHEEWGALLLEDDERAELAGSVPDLELKDVWG